MVATRSTARRQSSSSTRTSGTDASGPSIPPSFMSPGHSTATHLVDGGDNPPSSSHSLHQSDSRTEPSQGTVAARKSPRFFERKHTFSLGKDEELLALEQRLNGLQKDLCVREREVKKREAAVQRKSKAVERVEKGFSQERETIQKRQRSLAVKRREVDAESKEVASLKKRLTVAIERTQRPLNAKGVMSEPLWALAQLEKNFTCSLYVHLLWP